MSGDTRQAEPISPALQAMLDGLADEVALLDYTGTVLATNPKWNRSVERTTVPELCIGGNYFSFVSGLAAAGDTSALDLLAGLADVCAGRRVRSTSIYVGSGRLEGVAYEMIFSDFAPGGDRMILVSGHDVSEVLRLKHQRKRLGSRLLKAQEDERRRIARDLHDSTAQLLVGLQLSLARLRQTDSGSTPEKLLTDCTEAVDRIHREIRAFSFICHPPSLTSEGLAPALEAMVRGFGERAGLETEVLIGDPGEISHSVEATIYRLAQEALANIHRHSAAAKVAVSLTGTARYVHLVIRDDGHGFEPMDLDNSVPLGVGIAGMKQRLGHLGGRLTVHHVPEGISLIATLPRSSAS